MLQRSEEWYRARLGKLTASRIADATARTKSGYGASRATLMAELVVERLTGRPAERFVTASMQWGIETEAQARAAYEWLHDLDVEEVGFVDHPEIPHSGASPDGLVGGAGLLEIKCPDTKTHIETLLTRKVPERYLKQMQWQMACTGREWCDFASFDPRMPEELQLWVQRVQRDNDVIAELEREARLFLAELDEKVEALRSAANVGRRPIPLRTGL